MYKLRMRCAIDPTPSSNRVHNRQASDQLEQHIVLRERKCRSRSDSTENAISFDLESNQNRMSERGKWVRNEGADGKEQDEGLLDTSQG